MSTLWETVLTLPAASLGPLSPLPDLKSTGDVHEKIIIDEETVSAEEARFMGWGRISTILPYTMQDGYDRTRKKRDLKALVLENDFLRATFLPGLGGRLWSLEDREQGRELLHRNPVFQPANLALRNAWFSGGVEWNCGIIGHTPFTCDDVCCEEVHLANGTPVLRMFAYERVRHLFYRVEACLPDTSRELYVRVRIDNALNEDTAVYWWSNMAVEEREDIRVLVPAEKAFRYGYGGKLSKVPVPCMDAEADKLRGDAARLAREHGGILHWDISHPTCLPQSMDFFFDVPDGVQPYIAAVDRDGRGILQTSTDELRGRKLFAWGMGRGGRHWQTFLSQKGSRYMELQAGLARTQLEHLPMKAGSSISWLESYSALALDPELAQSPDWDTATGAVQRELEDRHSRENLQAMHERMTRELDGQTGKILHRSEGFILCERAIYGDEFDTFGLNLSAWAKTHETDMWEKLANEGIFPDPDPMTLPGSYQVGQVWEKALQDAVDDGRADGWFARYHLGVMAHARGDLQKAQAEYTRSIQLSENPWALRCLALAEPLKAPELLIRAARLVPLRGLALETMEALLQAGRFEDMLTFHDGLPEKLKDDGRVKTYHALALMRCQRCDEAEQALRGEITLTDVREGNTLLTDLWFELWAIRKYGHADEAGILEAQAQAEVPEHLDFRML